MLYKINVPTETVLRGTHKKLFTQLSCRVQTSGVECSATEVTVFSFKTRRTPPLYHRFVKTLTYHIIKVKVGLCLSTYAIRFF
jgi:hypothetical protein